MRDLRLLHTFRLLQTLRIVRREMGVGMYAVRRGDRHLLSLRRIIDEDGKERPDIDYHPVHMYWASCCLKDVH